MAHTVKLKNQAGIETIYGNIEVVTLPLVNSNEAASFAATYNVTNTAASSTFTFTGGKTAAYGVDYVCHLDGGSKSYKSVVVTIGGKTVAANTAYTVKTVNTYNAVLLIKGSYINGDISITATFS